MSDIDRRILAYALCDKSLAIRVVDRVPIKTLRPEFQSFLLAMGECVKKYNEVPTIEMLKRCDVWEDGFVDIFNELKDIKNDKSFESANFLLELEDLKERHKKNTILKVGKSVFKENWDGSEFRDLKEAVKSIRKVAGELDQLESEQTYKEGTVSATAEDAREEYIGRKENPEKYAGLKTGFTEFDRITNGLQPAELILIGGESSSGKSALSMCIAANCWLGSNSIPSSVGAPVREFATDGANVVYFTVEMPFNPFRRRLDACLAEVPLYGLRDGTLTPEEENRYYASLEFQKLYPKQFYIVDIPRGCTVSQIEAKYLELMYDFVPELVVVDYISLMKVQTDSESDWLSLGRIAEMLHEFCRTYNIPCISPVQLNRPKAGSDALPDQFRVGRSIMLPQNCNIMLNIQTRPDEPMLPDMCVNIAKMRDGERGAFVLYKRFDLMKLYNEPQDWFPEAEDEERI